MAWYKTIDLEELYESHVLDGFLPKPSDNNEYKTEETTLKSGKKKLRYKNNISLESLPRQILTSISNTKFYYSGTYSQNKINIKLKVNNEADYVFAFNDIVDTLNNNKSTWKYINTFSSELESALKYTMTQKLNGKQAPKLTLRVKDVNQIKGMTSTQKRNVVYNIMESIIFDDDFQKVQKWNQLQGKHSSGYGRYIGSKNDTAKYRLWKTLKKEFDNRYVVKNPK